MKQRGWGIWRCSGILGAFVYLLLLWPTIALAKTQANIIPSGGINGHHIKVIYRGLRLTDDYMKKTFDLEFHRPFEIHATTRQAQTEEDIRSGRIAGQANEGRVLVYVAEDSGDGNVLYTTAHEMIHQYQVVAVGSMDVLGRNMWFIEGMADVLAARIIAPLAPGFDKTFRKGARKAAKEGLNLAAVTSADGWQHSFHSKEDPYRRADAAVLYLTDHYPLMKLFAYLQELREVSAEEALRRVYGLSIAELEKAAARG